MKTNLNEKQLAQIESWLEGDARYKLLDRTRTAVLKLKGTLLQVWLACYMFESDDQQSWLSNAKLIELTGLSKHTVIEARRWLIENGWLRDTGHVAAMKYENPTQGAYSVRVFSVDDPTKGAEVAPHGSADIAPGAKLAPRSRKRGADSARAKVAPPSAEVAPKGSTVAVASTGTPTGTLAPTLSLTVQAREPVPAGNDSLREDRTTKTTTKTTTKATTKPKTSASAARWSRT